MSKAKKVLSKIDLPVIPTETVYVSAGIAHNETELLKIFQFKKCHFITH